MHLYLYVRGKFEQVKLWEAHAQCAYWKWRRINNETGKQEITLVQGALRPSVLGAYEYVFPKEALAEVCSFFGITSNISYGMSKIGLYTRHFCLRRIFGARKIPDSVLKRAKDIPDAFTTEEFERGSNHCKIDGVGIHVIGIKDDAEGVLGKYIQELL